MKHTVQVVRRRPLWSIVQGHRTQRLCLLLGLGILIHKKIGLDTVVQSCVTITDGCVYDF
jgi:hypothetical protein